MDKSTITYWLVLPGESEVNILTTNTIKAPKKGEIINITTTLEKMWLENRFRHLSEKQLKALVRGEERQVKGDFVVVDVKRWLKTRHVPVKSSEVFELDGGNNTSVTSSEIPVEVVTEDFEVYIEPFKDSELTETPIAKVRNLLSPILGSFEILNLIKENPEKEKELMELFRSSLETANNSIPKLRELLGEDKNWR